MTMRVGFVGVGLLGLPLARAVASRGHRVLGFDVDPNRMADGWFEGELPDSRVEYVDLDRLVTEGEVIFVCVDTPHASGYDGRAPFELEENQGYRLEPLKNALTSIAQRLESEEKKSVAICSTVLPGTVARLRREIAGLDEVNLVYNPSFTATGTVIEDFFDPEFVILGSDDEESARQVQSLYESLTSAPIVRTTIESAEAIKVCYNAFITMKIGFANTVMEIAHKTPGAHVDEIMSTLASAERRLVSSAYLEGGMGDGGGCHPKEAAATSALASDLSLSWDPFGDLLRSRDAQAGWVADVVAAESANSGLPVWVLGTAFKPEVAIEEGSASLLVAEILRRRGVDVRCFDPLIEERASPRPEEPAVYLLATRHRRLLDFEFPSGSVVVDPWRVVHPRDGVKVVPLGIG